MKDVYNVRDRCGGTLIINKEQSDIINDFYVHIKCLPRDILSQMHTAKQNAIKEL